MVSSINIVMHSYSIPELFEKLSQKCSICVTVAAVEGPVLEGSGKAGPPGTRCFGVVIKVMQDTLTSISNF